MNMMTSSNGIIFRVTGHLCGEFTGPGEIPAQRPVARGFDFFYLRLNKRLSKQPWGWWFETPSWSLWRQCNELGGSRHPHVPGRLMASKPNICWHRSWCTSSYKSRKICGAWRWQCHLVDDVAVCISWLNNWVCGLLGTLRGMRMGYIQYFLFLVHWNILLKP